MLKTHTQRAFVCLMIPLIHVAAFTVVILLFTVLKSLTDHSGIAPVFYLVDMLLMYAMMLLMLTFPVVQLGCGIRSIIHQVRALRNQESKKKRYYDGCVDPVLCYSYSLLLSFWDRMALVTMCY